MKLRHRPLLQLALSVGFLVLVGCTENRQQRILTEADERSSDTKYAEAAELYRKVVTLNPESKTALKAVYKLGFVQESYLKEFENAIFNYQEFIRLSPDPVAVYEVQKRIASLYFDQVQDMEKAITAYKKLLAYGGDSLEADFFQFRVAQAFFQQNKFDPSRIEYQTLIEKYPKSQYVAKTRYEIGNTYFMEGKYEIAIEALKQVLRNHPQTENALEAQFLMAQCYELLEKPNLALEIYQSIKGRYISSEVVNLRILQLKKRLKQTEK